jgi:glycosyltransferase involved in cell wall biosynthesis
MMHSLGHEIIHYGAENSEVSDWAEDVPIISAEEQRKYFGEFDLKKLYGNNCDWTGVAPYWKDMNARGADEIKKRQQKGDFVCNPMGRIYKPLTDVMSNDVFCVENGIGYNGVYAPYRIYESYAHMHKCMGAEFSYDPDGRNYHVVIPNVIDRDEFHLKEIKEDYFLYLGRLVFRKGIKIAVEATRRAGVKLVLAGQGVTKVVGNAIHCEDGNVYEGDHLQYVGPAIGEDRERLYQNARAVFLPTIYLEPFGTVAIEAQACGTPVITSDFGVFSETVEHGRTGWRCRTLDHFTWACKNVQHMDTRYIHTRAFANWDMMRVRHMYQEFFSMVADLHGNGWFTPHDDRTQLDWLRKY